MFILLFSERHHIFSFFIIMDLSFRNFKLKSDPSRRLAYSRAELLELYSTAAPTPTVVDRLRHLGLRSVCRLNYITAAGAVRLLQLQCDRGFPPGIFLRRYRGCRSGRSQHPAAAEVPMTTPPMSTTDNSRPRLHPILPPQQSFTSSLLRERKQRNFRDASVICKHRRAVRRLCNVERSSSTNSADFTSIGLFNAQSLGNKFAAVCERIIADRLHLCAVVETWHDSADSPCLIATAPPGYRYIEKSRPRKVADQLTINTNHGGLCLFYASFIGAREIPLPTYNSGLEALAVYVHGARRNALIIILYWPGSTAVTNAFFDDFSDILERTSTFGCPVILLGDINIHLDIVTDPDAVKFSTILDSHSLTQHISSATHRRGHTLDVFITTSDCPVASIVSEPPVLSDHSFISATVDLQFKHGQPVNIIRRRSWRQFNFDKFCNDLQNSALLISPPIDVTGLVDCYNKTLTDLLDKHAPFIPSKSRAHPNAPWYDRRCQLMKAETRRLEREYRMKKSELNLHMWRHQSRMLRFYLHKRYVEYWTEAINSNAGDSKALWSKISALLKAPQVSSDIGHTADDFANHFQSKVNNIRVTTELDAEPEINRRRCNNLTVMRETTVQEITEIIAKAPSKHCSLDPVPTWLLKRLVPILAITLSNITNVSIREGVFPAVLKQAIVRPRIKKSTLNPDDLASYRPISNLSFLSKMIERIVSARFTEHAESQNLLPCRQSAYRTHHSTETAIAAVHDEIVRAIDGGNICALVLLDLSSAFDTVDHNTLLNVLNRRFGIKELTLDWFKSYLEDRTQTFHVGQHESGPHSVSCSVPQGSVLGPKEFVAYTEQIEEVISQHSVDHHLYADDTQLIKPAQLVDIPFVIDSLQQCVFELHRWCASRRLQLNPSKTEIIWFGSRSSLSKMEGIDLALHVGSDVIEPTSCVRDLGVFLDCELSMKQHIGKVASACFYHLRRLRQVRRILGETVVARLVSAFILSRLDYCNSVLANLPKKSIEPLQRVQNAAARLVKNLGPRDHVSSALRELHWLPVQYRITYKLCLLMHLIHIGRSPSYITDLVTATANIPARCDKGLRSTTSHSYEHAATRLKFGERSFTFAGPSAWNSLPTSLQSETNTKTFKRKLKTTLFTAAFPS